MARSPRIRHLRHSEYARLRHSNYLLAWLSAQASRLALTGLALFETLKSGVSVAAIEAMDAAAAPVNSVAPVITGTAQEGETLTLDVGTWSDMSAGTYGVVWKRDDVAIDGATGTSYILVTGDVGTTITATVTATNAIGSDSATTAGVGPIAAAA